MSAKATIYGKMIRYLESATHIRWLHPDYYRGHMIQIKRVYKPVSLEDGHRYLVDRFWRRGIKRENLALEAWIKEVAPSDNLENWFAHNPAKGDGFCRRYFAELDDKPEIWRIFPDTAHQGNITLLFGAKDIRHNNAVALKLHLEAHHSPEGKQ